MQSDLAPTLASQLRIILAVIYGALSDRICSGMSRTSMVSAIVSGTPRPLIRRVPRDWQAFPGELVDQRHQPHLVAIVGLGLDKVIGPDMIAPLRT